MLDNYLLQAIQILDDAMDDVKESVNDIGKGGLIEAAHSIGKAKVLLNLAYHQKEGK